MAISEAHAGRRYPPTAPYEVSSAKIAEFAAALGDETAAADPLVAPPTFAVVVSSAAWQQLFDDRELELALSRIVHGDQTFRYTRPLRAGDVITAQLTIEKVRARAGREFISIAVAVATTDGEPVCTAESTLVHAREAAA